MQYLVDEFEKSLPPMGHPLRKLGVRLTELLDEDQWAECERLLLECWEHDAADRATGARKELAEAQSERDSLRKVIEFCKHKAAGMRVWGGMGWVYHPPQAKRIYEAAEAALAATKTGEQHDNFCT